MNTLPFCDGNPDLKTKKTKGCFHSQRKQPIPLYGLLPWGLPSAKRNIWLPSASENFIWKRLFSLRLHAAYVILDETPAMHITEQQSMDMLAPLKRKLLICHLLNDHQGTGEGRVRWCNVFLIEKNTRKQEHKKNIVQIVRFNCLLLKFRVQLFKFHQLCLPGVYLISGWDWTHPAVLAGRWKALGLLGS